MGSINDLPLENDRSFGLSAYCWRINYFQVLHSYTMFWIGRLADSMVEATIFATPDAKLDAGDPKFQNERKKYKPTFASYHELQSVNRIQLCPTATKDFSREHLMSFFQPVSWVAVWLYIFGRHEKSFTSARKTSFTPSRGGLIISGKIITLNLKKRKSSTNTIDYVWHMIRRGLPEIDTYKTDTKK